MSELASHARSLAALRGLHWGRHRRADQCAPDGEWKTWLLLGGRGAGKTRTGAEWVRSRVAGGAKRIGLVAPTLHDGRSVMVEGESGLLQPSLRGLPVPEWRPSLRELRWPGGAVAQLFSAEDPDGLRGPQFDCAWADEFCAWAQPEAALSNLRLGLRLGADPRLVVTTTPRPLESLKRLMAEEGTRVGRARTRDNCGLHDGFRAHMEELYGGTRLGRQELGGEVVEDAGGTLWPRELLARVRTEAPLPDFERIVVAVDPPVSAGKRADSCGIVVAGRSGDTVWVLDDATSQGMSPAVWARRVQGVWREWEADCVVAEANQGGEMVREVLSRDAPELPVRTVWASRGKRRRAEPVAYQYERGRVVHAGVFPELEDELNRLGTDDQKGSPDRADALVWAVASLSGTAGGPGMRRL